ncbi:metallophosphoesterase [Flavisolibacter sp. BT320]|nr:metallophosphoesterase [Flavisolibacter longurius]
MKKRGWNLVAGAVLLGGAVVLADAWWGERYFFETKRYRIGNSGGDKRVRILLFTDIHFKKYYKRYHQKLAQKIKALRPDLILTTGDLIDEYGLPSPANRFLHHLQGLAPLFAIPGNHDNKNGVSRQTLRNLVERNGGQLLVNETVQLRVRDVPFTITGLEDFIEADGNLAEAVREVGREENHLLLVHSPLQGEEAVKALAAINAERAESGKISLRYIFAGHTHGGQVRLPFYVPFLPKKAGGYVSGWYNNKAPFLYVSKGFGTSAVPFRFGARAELTVFDYWT